MKLVEKRDKLLALIIIVGLSLTLATNAEASAIEDEIYSILYNSLTKVDATADLSKYTNYENYSSMKELVSKVVLQIVDEHPEVFYWGGYSYSNLGRLEWKYDYSQEDILLMQQELNTKASEIITTHIRSTDTAFMKEFKIRDYIVQNTISSSFAGYDGTVPNICRTAYNVVVKGNGTMEGYAKATQLLLQKAGLETQIVRSSSGYMWNMVKIDGEYYHLDVNYKDHSLDPEGSASFGYFNVTDDKLQEERPLDRGNPPEATSDRFSYLWDIEHGVRDGNDIYFSNSADDDKLYRMKLDGTNKVKLADDAAKNVTTDGEWVYYWVDKHNEPIKHYKVRVDGSDKTALNYPINTEMYNKIATAILELQDEVDISQWPIHGYKALYTYNKVLDNHPEIFYMDFTYHNVDGRLVFNYEYDKEEIRYMQIELQDKVNSIISSTVKSTGSQLEKEQAIHDYLVLNTAYDETRQYQLPPEAHTAYGALVNGSAVCSGYSKALQLLLQELGIEAHYVRGLAGDGKHAWNMVKIDGEYHYVDATWNDPIPDKAGRVLHTYFNVSEKELAQTHTWDVTLLEPLGGSNHVKEDNNLSEKKPIEGDFSFSGVAADKVWTITFNKAVDAASLDEDTVFVTDTEGDIVAVKYEVVEDNKVTVTPLSNYTSGKTYILTITDVKALQRKGMNEPITVIFSVE